MPKDIYILVGAPGVGKSTWVEKEFQGECLVVSSDMIIEAVAEDEGKTYDEVFPKFVKVADKMMWADFDTAVSGNYNPIVVDRTNMSVKSRNRFFERLRTSHKGHGYTLHAVVFPKPDDEEYMRRLNSRPGKTIPANVIASMLQSFQMPTMEEGFDTVTVV